jgi:integrase
MARPSKPWYRTHDGWWYATIQGTSTKLAKGHDQKDEAERIWHELKAQEPAEIDKPGHLLTVVECFDLFLDKHCEANTESYVWYKSLLQSATRSFGKLRLTQLKVHHVQSWVDEPRSRVFKNKKGEVTKRQTYTLSDTAKNKCIGAVKAALNWCVQQQYVKANPIAAMRKPVAATRDRIISEDERKIIMASIKDEAFREFLFAMQESGARPGELYRATAENVSLPLGVLILAKHKTAKKTRRPRIIYMTPPLKELITRLVLKHPEGPIFRNSRGRPWNRNSLRNRFRHLRAKFPQLAGIVCYSVRTTYATDALAAGVAEAVVAELMGHKGTATLSRHYNKLHQKIDVLREAARKATGS